MVALAPRVPVTSRLRAIATSAVSAVKSATGRAITPHKAALGRLTDIPLTVAGMCCIDFAAFHVAHGWGWLVTGILLIPLEHAIADEQ